MIKFQDIISINPNIRFGKPCITGSRISVYDVLGWLGSGMSYEDIMEDFPEITKDQILACLQYSAAKGENTKIIVSA